MLHTASVSPALLSDAVIIIERRDCVPQQTEGRVAAAAARERSDRILHH